MFFSLFQFPRNQKDDDNGRAIYDGMTNDDVMFIIYCSFR